MKYKKVILSMMTMATVVGNSVGAVLAEEIEALPITESRKEVEIQTEEPQPAPEPQPVPESAPTHESEPVAEPEPSVNPQPATESQPVTEEQSVAESITEAAPETSVQPQTASELESEKVSEKTEIRKEVKKAKETAPQVKEISSVQVTGVEQVEGGGWNGMQETAACTTEGILNHQARLTHAYISTVNHYTVYRRTFVTAALTTEENYRFADTVAGTVNGLEGEVVRKSDTEIEVTAYLDFFTHWHSTGNGVGMSESPIPTNYNETEHWYQCQDPSCPDVESTIRDVEPHEFTGEIVGTATLKTPRTCTEPAVYYKSCVCGYIGTEETFTFGDPLGHDIPEDAEYESDETQHWKSCVREGCDWEEREDHTGGTATCIEPAVCDVCHESYGETDPENHEGDTVLRDEKEATTEEEGYTGDLYCADCDTLLEKGEVIPKLEAEEPESEEESDSEEESESEGESDSEEESESEEKSESETEETTEPETEKEEKTAEQSETESDTEKESESQKKTVKKNAVQTESAKESSGSGTAVQTGDQTETGGYLAAMAGALAVLAAGLKKRKKRL